MIYQLLMLVGGEQITIGVLNTMETCEFLKYAFNVIYEVPEAQMACVVHLGSLP